jgi:hypothetical protein
MCMQTYNAVACRYQRPTSGLLAHLGRLSHMHGLLSTAIFKLPYCSCYTLLLVHAVTELQPDRTMQPVSASRLCVCRCILKLRACGGWCCCCRACTQPLLAPTQVAQWLAVLGTTQQAAW